MALFGKIFNRLTLRCIGAIAFGMLITALFASLLAIYAGVDDPDNTVAAAVAFPDSDAQMSALSNSVPEGLQDIEPAAGE